MRDLTRQDLTREERWIGGNGSHAGDCYVWAEINYLDSPTDYREFLPSSAPSPMPPIGELVMLDDGATFPRTILTWLLETCSWFSAV
jgi:hypothetical protein